MGRQLEDLDERRVLYDMVMVRIVTRIVATTYSIVMTAETSEIDVYLTSHLCPSKFDKL